MSATGTVLALSDVRARAATVLAPATDTDPDVISEVVDSLTPPAIVLMWGDPWLEVGVGAPVMGPCLFTARLKVLCVGARFEPGPGVEQVEDLVAYTVGRFRADPYPWALDDIPATGQRAYRIGGLDYLASEVNYAVTVTV